MLSSSTSTILPHLSLSPSTFNLQQILLTLCKPTTNPPQIDFLTLPQTLETINSFHQRTCQQIVQFVDAHCQEYLKINQKFDQLKGNVEKVEGIIKELGVRLGDYAKVYYNNEGKVQQLISNYELSILQHVLLTHCKQLTHFLTQFVSVFESIATKSITQLSFNQRHMLIKFCHSFLSFTTILKHHIVQQSIPQSTKIEELMVNLVDEVEFYLSQQLQRVVGLMNNKKNSDDKQKQNNSYVRSKGNKNTQKLIINEIKLCYTYLNKQAEYYRLIEQHLISLQIQLAQRNLITQKINLIGGKNIQVVEQYFKAIFNIFNHLPQGYPKQRVLQLIFSLLKKTQIKFLYTYTLPIFPISYNCFNRQIDLTFQKNKQSQIKQIKQRLRKNHNWDLRRWVDVREKNVLDRCGKDWQKCLQVKDGVGMNNSREQMMIKKEHQLTNTNNLQTNTQIIPNIYIMVPDLLKWLQIIFKQNCKIDGVKNHIVSLALKVINKYALIIQKSLSQQSLQPQFINSFVRTYHSIEYIMTCKLMFFYDCQLQGDDKIYQNDDSKEQLRLVINKIALSSKQSLRKAIQKVILSNTKLLTKSCSGCLQPYKQFIMKIIKPSLKQQNNNIKCVNLFQTVFKPLLAYLQNSFKLSQQSKLWIKNIVIKQVIKYYDQSYVTEIYQYARVNLNKEQLTQVMAVVDKERSGLFVTDQDKFQQISS